MISPEFPLHEMDAETRALTPVPRAREVRRWLGLSKFFALNSDQDYGKNIEIKGTSKKNVARCMSEVSLIHAPWLQHSQGESHAPRLAEAPTSPPPLRSPSPPPRPCLPPTRGSPACPSGSWARAAPSCAAPWSPASSSSSSPPPTGVSSSTSSRPPLRWAFEKYGDALISGQFSVIWKKVSLSLIRNKCTL